MYHAILVSGDPDIATASLQAAGGRRVVTAGCPSSLFHTRVQPPPSNDERSAHRYSRLPFQAHTLKPFSI